MKIAIRLFSTYLVLCGSISSFRLMVSKFKKFFATASSSRAIDDLCSDTAVQLRCCAPDA